MPNAATLPPGPEDLDAIEWARAVASEGSDSCPVASGRRLERLLALYAARLDADPIVLPEAAE